MRPPRLPPSRLFHTPPPFTVILAVLASLVLMFCAVEARSSEAPFTRLAIERAVYRALIDSLYTTPIDSGTSAPAEIMLRDHFDAVQMVVGDLTLLREIGEWLRASVPQLTTDAWADFSHRGTDTSSIITALLPAHAARTIVAAQPFGRTRAHIHLLDDSTLARFLSAARRQASGWVGLRAAFPNATGIMSISRVGLSRDGRWAIVYACQQSDWLAVGGFVYVLQRSGPDWRIVKSTMIWVS